MNMIELAKDEACPVLIAVTSSNDFPNLICPKILTARVGGIARRKVMKNLFSACNRWSLILNIGMHTAKTALRWSPMLTLSTNL